MGGRDDYNRDRRDHRDRDSSRGDHRRETTTKDRSSGGGGREREQRGGRDSERGGGGRDRSRSRERERERGRDNTSSRDTGGSRGAGSSRGDGSKGDHSNGRGGDRDGDRRRDDRRRDDDRAAMPPPPAKKAEVRPHTKEHENQNNVTNQEIPAQNKAPEPTTPPSTPYTHALHIGALPTRAHPRCHENSPRTRPCIAAYPDIPLPLASSLPQASDLEPSTLLKPSNHNALKPSTLNPKP